MPSDNFTLCRTLLLLPSTFPSIRVFSNESTLHMRWPKYWSLSFSISPSNEHPGLISFRMDWLDLLVAQGTLKSFLQHHSSKASIFRHSAEAPLSVGLFGRNTGMGFLLQGINLPNPGIKAASPAAPALGGRFFTTQPPGKSSGSETRPQICLKVKDLTGASSWVCGSVKCWVRSCYCRGWRRVDFSSLSPLCQLPVHRHMLYLSLFRKSAWCCLDKQINWALTWFSSMVATAIALVDKLYLYSTWTLFKVLSNTFSDFILTTVLWDNFC